MAGARSSVVVGSISPSCLAAYSLHRRHVWALRSVSRRGKTVSPAGGLTMASAAFLIRATVNHRLGNALVVIAWNETPACRAVARSAEAGRRRSERLRGRFRPIAYHGAQSRGGPRRAAGAASSPMRTSAAVVAGLRECGLASDLERRDGEAGKSGPEAT